MASAISPITAPSPEFRHFAAGGAGNNLQVAVPAVVVTVANLILWVKWRQFRLWVDGRGSGGASGHQTTQDPMQVTEEMV